MIASIAGIVKIAGRIERFRFSILAILAIMAILAISYRNPLTE
jgi:hypothetical protein